MIENADIIKNRYFFLVEIYPKVNKLATTTQTQKFNRTYVEDVLAEIKIRGCKVPLFQRIHGAMKRRSEFSPSEKELCGEILDILSRVEGIDRCFTL